MASEWIQSNAGPMLLLPSELLSGWGGTTTTDYERACEVYGGRSTPINHI